MPASCSSTRTCTSAWKTCANQLQFSKPNEEELTRFLCEEKGFSLERVEGIKKRLKACHSAKPQMSLEAFFGKPKKLDDGKTSEKKKSVGVKESTKKGKK